MNITIGSNLTKDNLPLGARCLINHFNLDVIKHGMEDIIGYQQKLLVVNLAPFPFIIGLCTYKNLLHDVGLFNQKKS